MSEVIRPYWMTGGVENDWKEDSHLENGGYYNECVSCGLQFIGHKRRLVCKSCDTTARARYRAMTQEEREAHDARRREEVADALKKFRVPHGSFREPKSRHRK